jgi:tetratricopeptide (TPR) repeat protein
MRDRFAGRATPWRKPEDWKRRCAPEALEALVSLKPLDLTARRRLALQLVAVDPQRAEPHLKFVLENQEHPEEMLRGIVDLIESQENAEDRAYLLARIGQMLLRYGQWDMAARTLRHAVEEEPDYPQALSLLAVALINLGEDAGEELEAAAELAPEDPVNHIFRSMAFMRDGEIDAGITELETAAALDPDNPATLAQLGAAYALRGDLKLALDGYLGAAEISDHGGDFWLLLAQFCNANQYQVAAIGLPAARNAYSLDPESPAVLDAIGYAHFLLGDLPLAERFLQRAVAAHPLEPLTQYHLALLRLTQNQPKAAQAALELAIQLEPDPSLVLLAERSLRAIAP